MAESDPPLEGATGTATVSPEGLGRPYYMASQPPRPDGRTLDLLVAMDEPLLLARELIAIADLGTQRPNTGVHWARLGGRMRDALRDIDLMDEERRRS